MAWIEGLALSATLLGVASAPHCAMMCGPACTSLMSACTRRPMAQAGDKSQVQIFPRGSGEPASITPSMQLAFHGGRLLSYAATGALVASATGMLATLSATLTALKPLWLLMHAVVLSWGIVLAAVGRQPLWAAQLGRGAMQRAATCAASPRGLLAVGSVWALMPCGMLYSALMLAALAGSPFEGATLMVLFGAGGAAGLWLAPRFWSYLRGGQGTWRAAAGTRVAGLLLATAAGYALWMDLREQVARWCA
ncbi:hypothetical protein DFR41_10953 [Pseudacidovorax intermedius]|uniref:Urease accessory protein UreH-like transmembrane domain-containing protein n=1 Tax=Pseudacidovorax intermedius TaxID=433924 RepID=A0A370F9C9_9BURK|nr:sulfite exporter TauE/SafE family protein [Pseudacidovorax intermedius]RDI21257.1 hypothetical protein DFR41_10953 [Pseudacidovorax intermedius]